jgi:hypothetical protein
MDDLGFKTFTSTYVGVKKKNLKNELGFGKLEDFLRIEYILQGGTRIG